MPRLTLLFVRTLCWSALLLAGTVSAVAGEATELPSLEAELASRDETIRRLQLEVARLRKLTGQEQMAQIDEVIASPDAEQIESGNATSELDYQPQIWTAGPARSQDDDGLFDNFSLFLGLEGSKQPQDFGVNATMGGRASFNWGIPLGDTGIGFQFGSSINYTDNAVQVMERVNAASDRTQVFTTVGFFQRLDSGFKWGIVYDFLFQNYYDQFHLGQWRGRFGYDVSDKDEIGVLVNLTDREDTGVVGGALGPVGVTLRAITQGSVYWRHTFEQQSEVTIWAGVAEGHAEANLALGDLAPQDEVLLLGSELHLPLNDYLAVFGQANFLLPASTGTVDAYLGFAIYPGGRARGARQRRFAPLLPVANNPTFSTDLSR